MKMRLATPETPDGVEYCHWFRRKTLTLKMKSEAELKNLVTILDTIVEHLISACSTSEIAD